MPCHDNSLAIINALFFKIASLFAVAMTKFFDQCVYLSVEVFSFDGCHGESFVALNISQYAICIERLHHDKYLVTLVFL